jgi:1-acyl-sn-glycerol-3-phosphate acyltransferase
LLLLARSTVKTSVIGLFGPDVDAPDFPLPHPIQFKGNAFAGRVLKLMGWQVAFAGLPAQQGVLVVYPHTSNWDFVVMMLAKWSVGVPARFWGKHSLFSIPVFGRWLRWLGGVPVNRSAPGGIVRQAREIFAQRKATGEYFWLGLAPEGTRKHIPGWRSGFYQAAVAAQVPLGLVQLDYARRLVDINCFIRLSGQPQSDMARIARHYQGVTGKIPANAAPVVLLDAAVGRSDTVAK